MALRAPARPTHFLAAPSQLTRAAACWWKSHGSCLGEVLAGCPAVPVTLQQVAHGLSTTSGSKRWEAT
eukprot:2785354-Alexandrium_andersonii.AAC.1